MRNRLIHYMIRSILCITLLFTMGSDIGTVNNHHTETTSDPAMEIVRQTNIQPDSDTERITNLSQKGSPPSLQPVEMKAPQIHIEQHHAEATKGSYTVTAYYLNVRAEASSKSKILDVVSKGSILEVLKRTDNGWLELESGGYVHSNYATMVAGNVKPSEDVKILSYEQSSQPTTLVQSNSGLTEEQIAKIIKGTALEGEGLEKAILNVENDYGINAYFTIAVMKLESGHGKSRIAKTKNNLFGLNATGKDPYKNALSFKTKAESVQKFGHIISTYYLEKGLTNIEKVAKKYCGVNPKWSALVMSIMKGDYKKII